MTCGPGNPEHSLVSGPADVLFEAAKDQIVNADELAVEYRTGKPLRWLVSVFLYVVENVARTHIEVETEAHQVVSVAARVDPPVLAPSSWTQIAAVSSLRPVVN